MDNNLNNPYQQPQYQPTNAYQPQTPSYQPELEEPVSLGDWIGSLLLFSFVPCVGLIICIVWAFSKNTKKSKANFCKAYLIVTLIGIVLSVIMVAVYVAMFASLFAGSGFSDYGYYYY